MNIIAIDGPSAAGKSTVAKLTAKRLGWTYLDTGAMYRTVALRADREGLDFEEGAALEKLCRELSIEFIPSETGEQKVLLNGEDVSALIREHRISDMASKVSAMPPVREAMAKRQREMGGQAPCVVEGRDIGSVIFPDAILKIYMTASDEERAQRRASELTARGQRVDPSEVLETMKKRDLRDSSRKHAPLVKAPDAEEIDTTNMDIEQVVDLIEKLLKDKLAN